MCYFNYFYTILGLILWPGTLIKWWLCPCSALLYWFERRWGSLLYLSKPKLNISSHYNFITLSHSLLTCENHLQQKFVLFFCDWFPSSSCYLIQGLMQSCNQMQACYLFQQDKHYDLSYDTGDKALQCGRHVDIFKLWLMWRAKVLYSFMLNVAWYCKTVTPL